MALATPLDNRGRRLRLREIGDSLVRALELAHRFQGSPTGWGAFAAWSRAQDATRQLGDEIGALMPAPEVLVAAEDRARWACRRRSG